MYDVRHPFSGPMVCPGGVVHPMVHPGGVLHFGERVCTLSQGVSKADPPEVGTPPGIRHTP